MAKDPRQKSLSKSQRPTDQTSKVSPPGATNPAAGKKAVRQGKSRTARSKPADSSAAGAPAQAASNPTELPVPDSADPKHSSMPIWQNTLFKGGAGIALILVGSLIGWLISGGGDDANNVAKSTGTSGVGTGASEETPSIALPDIPNSPAQPVACRIYTTEPGFQVFVDGELVRNEKGEPLVTPCEVTVDAGSRLLTVAKTGWTDSSRIVNLTKPQDVDFDLASESSESSGAESAILSAPYLNAKIHEPIPLTTVNETGQFSDPFLSADGLSIWIAGDGNEGRGIYYSTRTSPFDEFGPPTMLALSRGNELPASPSITLDSKVVAFAVPEKARVWGLSRESPLGSFDNKDALKYNPRSARVWESSLISPDGKRLYWRERSESRVTSWMATRKKLDEEFGRPQKIELPGGHPCLSRDGLRQFHYDGETLKRYRRFQVDSDFADPEIVATFELPEFVPRDDARQIWVTEDEQWMYYCVDPLRDRRLAMVRLSDGPIWGYSPRGKSIPPRPKPTEPMPKPYEPTTEPEPEPMPVAVDPRTLPLPYVALTKELQNLIAARDYAGAESLIQKGIKNPELQADRRLLDWDLNDVASLQAFWRDAEKVASELKAGDTIRLGAATVEFLSFKNGKILAKGKSVEVEKPLIELSGTDLVALVDRIADKQDPNAQLPIGIFMYYDSRGESNSARGRLDLAEGAGNAFLEQLARRKLQQISQEFERENLSLALKLVDELAAFAPNSESARLASEYRQKAYTFVKWEQRGSRNWNPTADGTYTASTDRANGSLLISPREFSHFELSLEWTTEGATGQGGVYFRYPGSGRLLESALKVQLANDFGIPADNFCTGAIFNRYPPNANKVKKSGDWNTLKMQVAGEQVRVFINGSKVLDASIADPDIPLRGYIALDGEIGGITYRKILLIETPETPLSGGTK